MTANAESLENLRANLVSHGRLLDTTPHVFQLNKRDLADVAPVSYMEFLLNRGSTKADCIEATAVRGDGVAPTLNTICKMILAQFIEEHNMKVSPAVSAASA